MVLSVVSIALILVPLAGLAVVLWRLVATLAYRSYARRRRCAVRTLEDRVRHVDEPRRTGPARASRPPTSPTR